MTPPRRPAYTLMLVVDDALLHTMAAIIGAEYDPATYERAVQEMYDRDEWAAEWEMTGSRGRFAVYIERTDSILTCTLWAEEPYFQEGKEAMWRDFLACGGNPAAERSPWGDSRGS